ncbi:MAG: hypothetical protein AAB691_00145, partial [Patescibacteria group bacterium]
SILLSTPVVKAGNFAFLEGKVGYFIIYILQHYWLNAFLSLLLAITFYLFLKSLKKYRERFFDVGETRLGGILALLAGWPNGFVFIALSFIFVVIIASLRMTLQKERFTTLGLPFLLAAFTVLVLGDIFAAYTGLAVLNI